MNVPRLVKAYKYPCIVSPMERTTNRSLGATTVRCLQISVFTLLFLLFSQLNGNAQTIEDCPLCPTNGARDTLPPHIKCYPTTNAYLDSVGYSHVYPLRPLSLLGDNCPVLTVWASQTRFYCRDIGVKNMIIFAQDSAGNIAKCTTRVSIIDTVRSKIVNCPRDTSFRLNGGECASPKFNFDTPSVTDNCSAPLTMVLRSNLPSGSVFPSGVSTVLFEATNSGGVKSTCSFRVSVNEFAVTAGSLLCPAALDVGIDASCQATLVARDLLSGTNLHCLADYKLSLIYNATTLPSNTINGSYIGKIIKAQIFDLQTNGTCNTTLTIKDITAPRIAAPADFEVTCAQTSATIAAPTSLTGVPTVLADCSPTTVNFSDVSLTTPCTIGFTTMPQGFPATLRFDSLKGQNAARIIIREFTVTDLSGNAAKIKQAIYVRKTNLSLVVFPSNINVSCRVNGFNTTPDSVLSNGIWLQGTGNVRLTNGAAINGGDCQIAASFNDRRVNTATGYTIFRTWSVVNLCTNETKTSAQSINITDNAPVITCKTDYAAAIVPTTGIATIPALSLVNTLTDECTPFPNLMVRIQRLTGGMPWPDSVEVTFNCNDTGRTSVELLVKDATGLMSKCQTTVQISDPNSVCRAQTQAAIFGIIETEERKPIVATVKVQSATNPNVWQMTRASNYSFLGMPRGDNCELTPSRDSDLLNGVTTFDVALMSRHILDVAALSSPLKLVAADVNADGSIDGLDMVITRRLILRQTSAFPDNKSWRFAPKVYQFPPTANTNPALSFPDFLAFVNLTDTVRGADFWAIKTGDLNGTANGNAFGNAPTVDLRGAENALILNADNEFLEKDKTYDIEISSDKMDADGFQFTLNVDKYALKILSIEQSGLSNFNHTNYALFPSEGKATVSWNGSLDSKTSPMTLFRLRLFAKQTGRLRDALRLNSDLTPAEAFSLAGATRSVELTFKGIPNNDFTLFQNEPNPTIDGSTNIRFRLPKASDARLTLYDISGKIMHSETRLFDKGDNAWRILTPSVSGVFLYRLDTPTHSATRRMVVGN